MTTTMTMMIMLLLSVVVTDADKLWTVKEETKPGQVIDYLKLRSQGQQVRIFNIHDRGVSVFGLDPHTGALTIATRLDREAICPAAVVARGNGGRSIDEQCEVRLKIATVGSSIMVVTIVVEDINDHAPKWPQAALKVTFTENEPVGSRRSLPEATDTDAGINGQISYSLDTAHRSQFRVFRDNGLYIETSRPLDRERLASYRLRLRATDGGLPTPRSSELTLEIEVVDINDNTPRFTNSLFRPERPLREDVRPDFLVLRLTALDADQGDNGAMVFRLSPNTPPAVATLFKVTPTGEVRVRRPLDYDADMARFEFKVVVQDCAVAPYTRSSEATVEIDVQDVNDETPHVLFYAMDPSPSSSRARVRENQKRLSVIGQLSVKDADFKGHDKVSCKVLSAATAPLELIHNNNPSEFEVVTSRRFDYEVEKVIWAQVECQDSAEHRVTLNISVEVQDVNDNAPQCGRAVHYFQINENLRPGSYVEGPMAVTDADSGKNGQLTLSVLLAPPGTEAVPFEWDSNRARLRSRATLDRERVSEYSVLLAVQDSGIPPQSVTCTVTVKVRDVNDNPVHLSPDFYTFHVLENEDQPIVLGTLQASDADNSSLRFSLVHRGARGSGAPAQFRIDLHSGRLVVHSALDREVAETHVLLVRASDGLNSATASVTVVVDDVNDNAPIFIDPQPGNKIIKVNTKEAPGYRVKRVQANDNDAPGTDNSVVRFKINKTVPTRLNGLFDLDADSGELYLARALHEVALRETSIFLDLEACDLGKPQRCSVLDNVEIRWIGNGVGSPSLGSGGQGSSKDPSNLDGTMGNFRLETIINENVLIAIISGLLLLMIVILVGFFLFKRKSIFYATRPGRSDSTQANKNIQKTLISYADNCGPPNYNCNTELRHFKDTNEPEISVLDMERHCGRSPSMSATMYPYIGRNHQNQDGNNPSGDNKSRYESKMTVVMGDSSTCCSPISEDPTTVAHHHQQQQASEAAGLVAHNDFSCRQMPPQAPATVDNYYSKYMVDRYLKISNSDGALSVVTGDTGLQQPRGGNPKNESSFV